MDEDLPSIMDKVQDNKDNEDNEDNNAKKNFYNNFVRNQDISVQDRGRGFQQNYPSSETLRAVADEILTKVGGRNNDKEFHHEIPLDTISVARTNKGELIIAGNLKERRVTDTNDKNQFIRLKLGKDAGGGKEKATYKNYGLTQELAKSVGDNIKRHGVYKNSNLSVKVIEEKLNPLDNKNLPNIKVKSDDHAAKHAEMKIKAHCKKEDKSVKSIGISKPACKECHLALNDGKAVVSPGEAGQKKVTNWRVVGDDEVEVRYQINRNEVESDMRMYSNNIGLNKEAIKGVLKQNVDIKRCMKPGGSVGLISGVINVMDTIETNNTEPYTNANVLTTNTGVADNILGIGSVAYASASVAEVSAGRGGIVGASASALSVSAHAEYGLNNSAGVGASVVRAAVNVGPAVLGVGVNLNTEVHAGVNGIGASFLGMGFNIGPSIQIKTILFDFSVNLF